MTNCTGNVTRRLRGRSPRRAGAALYIAVVATAALVTVLGLAGLIAVQVQRLQSTDANHRVIARIYARSAVELALAQLRAAAAWRNSYDQNEESSPLAVGDPHGGTVSWALADSDGSFTNADTLLRIRGIGRVGDAVQVSSVQLERALDEVGPAILRQMISTSSSSQDDVSSSKSWCQYLKVTLPADAIGWRVTSVDFFCQRVNSSRNFTVAVCQPDAANWPTTTMYDSKVVSSSTISSTNSWQTISLTGQYSIPADQGACITLTSTSSTVPIRISYRSGGMTEADSALVTGGPAWDAYAADKALRYRLNGVYTKPGVGCNIVEGTWTWDSAP